MKRSAYSIFWLLALLVFSSCDFKPKATLETSPKEKIEFGRLLFFDARLSKDNTISCASCHNPGIAFTDNKKKSIGINGNTALRNSPSLLNSKDATSLMYDGAVSNLEMQAIIPIQDLNEMGISMGELIEKLKKIPEYKKMAKQLFARELDAFVVTRALAAYERTLVSTDTRFDAFKKSNYTNGFTANEQRGWNLFSKELNCIACHQLPNFTTYEIESNGFSEGKKEDMGRYRITGLESDKWKFKVPSLRNVSITGPYLHDGSVSSLRELIHNYFTSEKSPVYNRVKKKNSKLDEKDLISFLNTLTDRQFD